MSIYQEIANLEAKREPFALCTVVHSQGSTPRGTGSKMVVLENGEIIDTIGGGEMESRVIAAAQAALQDGKTRLLSYNFADPGRGDPGVCGGQVEVYVEPNLPTPTLVIVGVGHVGQTVAHLGAWLGFHVVASDDRPDFSTPETVPLADEYHVGPLSELPEFLAIRPWTYIVLTTRGVDVDVEGLPRLLDSNAGYIGVIGSRRRWAVARAKMLEMGVPAEKIGRVRSPIGLELNAETPEEIAVSILAEIIMLRRGGDGQPMVSAEDPAAAAQTKIQTD
jgi:xanthine dehydrogenase accessory factor